MQKQLSAFENIKGLSAFIPLDDYISKKRTFPDSEVKGWVLNSFENKTNLFFAYQRDSELNEGTFIVEDEALTGKELEFHKEALLNELKFLDENTFSKEIEFAKQLLI